MATPIVNKTKTFGEMVDEVSFFVADGEAIFPQESIKRAVNSALAMVHNTSHREPVDAYFNTEAGVRQYDIPDNRFDGGEATIEAVWVGDTALAFAEYDIVKSTDAQGVPTTYSRLGSSLFLDPVPADIYVVHVLYRREFEALANLSDTVRMSDVEIHAAILYACYLLKMKDEEFQSANAFKAASDEALALASKFPAGIYEYSTGRMR